MWDKEFRFPLAEAGQELRDYIDVLVADCTAGG